MLYCTKQDLIDSLGETEVARLTDRTNQGVIDDAVLERAIRDVSAQIDGYLVGRYQLPLSVVPPVLVLVACDLTRYRLYVELPPENVATQYKNQIEFLKSLAAGKVSLGISDNGAKPAPANSVQHKTGGKVFGRDDNGGGFV